MTKARDAQNSIIRESADNSIPGRSVTSLVLNNFKNDSRVIKTCNSLLRNGFDIRVIAIHEEGLPEIEAVDGFEVNRIRLRFAKWPRTKLLQAVRYIEFSLRVIFRFNNSEIYHCNDLHTLPVGILLKLISRRNVKIVYDAHEYETETVGLGKLERFVRRTLEKVLITFVDRVVTVSDGIANEYVRLYGIEKPTLILNMPVYADVEKTNLLRQNLGITDGVKLFLYQGGLFSSRGIDVLLDAFEDGSQNSYAIVFMGYGPLEAEIRSRASQSDCIFFQEAVPPAEVLNYTCSADVGISTIENTCLSYYYCLPNKLFEYLMAEIPVIVSNMYEMEKIVTQFELGVVASDNSVSGIRQAITEINQFDLDKFARTVGEFKNKFNWEAQESVLIDLYRNI